MTSAVDSSDAGGERSSPPAVELIDITKRFGQVVACDDVDLVLAPRADPRHPRRERRRQVDADEGADRPGRCPTPARSRSHGEQVAHPRPASTAADARHRDGAPALQPRRGDDGVGERRARRRRARSTRQWIRQRVGEISEQYGLDVDPDARVADLSAGFRQRVEIIKCLRRDPAGADLRRADVGAVAGRVGVPVRRAARVSSTRKARPSRWSATSCPRSWRATDDITIMRDGRVVGRHATAVAGREQPGAGDGRPRRVAARRGRCARRRARRRRRRAAPDATSRRSTGIADRRIRSLRIRGARRPRRATA